jgi:hypothetical protein
MTTTQNLSTTTLPGTSPPTSNWKSNRKIQFAVGVTVIFLLLRWLVTGDLFAVYEAAKPPTDGETKAFSLISIVGPMMIEAVIIVGVSAIAFGLRIWGFFVDFIDSFQQKTSQIAANPAQNQQIEPAFLAQNVANESPEGLVRGLVKAIATNDAASIAKFETQIRRPYALGELTSALEQGNFDQADELMRELKELSGVASAPPAATRAAKGGAK